jgi:molybdopterin-guanine dinucleotide biosynthesis protein A
LPSAPMHSSESVRLWHCLCGFYRSQCFASLEMAIHQGERSFQQWLRGQVVAAIPDVAPLTLTNCNTPEQWRQVQALELSTN